MTGPTYDQIIGIMLETVANVVAAGHDPKLCVWELSPSLRQTMHDHFIAAGQMVPDLTGNRQESFMGIPIRQGVTDEATGILLKMVNLNPVE